MKDCLLQNIKSVDPVFLPLNDIFFLINYYCMVMAILQIVQICLLLTLLLNMLFQQNVLINIYLFWSRQSARSIKVR